MTIHFGVRWLSAAGLELLVFLSLCSPGIAQVNQETGGGALERFDCESAAVPHANDQCSSEVEHIRGVPDFSCARPASIDQRRFCGAVYGYEVHWCQRVGNAALRAECERRTE